MLDARRHGQTLDAGPVLREVLELIEAEYELDSLDPVAQAAIVRQGALVSTLSATCTSSGSATGQGQGSSDNTSSTLPDASTGDGVGDNSHAIAGEQRKRKR